MKGFVFLIAVAGTMSLGLIGATPAVAQTAETVQVAPEEDPLVRPVDDSQRDDFLWTHRLIVVFADSEADPRFQQQIERLTADADALRERDVLVLVDTDPKAGSPFREDLRPRGFMWVLIGKDGNVYLRKPFPWRLREIVISIDKNPLRQQEIRDRRAQ